MDYNIEEAKMMLPGRNLSGYNMVARTEINGKPYELTRFSEAKPTLGEFLAFQEGARLARQRRVEAIAGNQDG